MTRAQKLVIIREPGPTRLFYVCVNKHVAGTRYRPVSDAGAGRHPALPVPAALARGVQSAVAAVRPPVAPGGAGQHAAGHPASVSASLRFARGEAKWQR